MKNTLLLTASLALSVCANAQITLDATNAPTIAICQVQDSMNVQKLSGFIPDFSPATNGVWDLTAVVDSYDYHFFNAPYSGAAFPTATFNLPVRYWFSALSYGADKLYDVTAAGIEYYGEHIDRQALPIGALTGAPTDTLTFVEQDIPYSSSGLFLKYPCTMGTTWTDVTTSITDFELSVAAYGLSNAPGQRKSISTVEYTVVGWGKMRVNNKDGVATAYSNVLQLEVHYSVEDSFFLGGSLAPAPLLTAFGISQGQVGESFYRRFFRAGELRELAEVMYVDGTYSEITTFRVHRQRLPMPATSVGSSLLSDMVAVYPNPITGNTFSIKLNSAASEASYELYNVVGQRVAAGAVPANGTIALSNDIPTGNYFVKVKTQDGGIVTKQVNILR